MFRMFPRPSALFAAALLASTAASASTEPWQLQPAPLLRALSLSPAAVESWYVHLDGQPPTRGHSWRLPLPEGLSEWQTDQLDLSVNGDFRWRGKASDGSDQHALIVRQGEAMSGLLSTRDGLYEVIPSADGNLLVRLESSLFPACAGGVDAPQHDTPAQSMVAPELSVPEGTTVQIDVMVLYTPQARDGAGGVAGIEALAQAAVDASNLAFANAQATPRFNLVSTRLANRNDSGNGSSDLSWVRSHAEVAQWRNEVGADMVGLIVNNAGSGCGIGYVMRNVSPGFAGSAFQVTARGCAVGNLTYAHEPRC